MKQRLCLFGAALTAALFLAGCGGSAASQEPADSVPAAPPASSVPAQPEAELQSEPAAQAEGSDMEVDVDLTTLSSTMVFAEVSNLMYDPIPYLGKTVRMQGEFSVDHAYTMDGELDLSKNYFYCIIEDALACCAQGLEFSLADPPAYPEGYPEEGSQITVVGTVEFFEENGFRHLRLGNAYFSEEK